MFHFIPANLLPHRLTRPLKELMGSSVILWFAVSAANLFEPIYLYLLDISLARIALFYLLMYVAYFLLIPLGAKFALRFGSEKALVLGSSLLILYYLALFGIERAPWLFFVAPLLCAVHKMFYWMGYHADFAETSNGEEVGRELGETNLLVTLVTVAGPMVGAFLIATLGFSALFIAVAGLILLSNIPLLTTRQVVAPKPFSYRHAYRQFFAPDNGRQRLALLGYGDEILFMVFWPIFLYVVTSGVVGVGMIVTFSALLTALVALYVGSLTDFKDRFVVLQRGTMMIVFAWLARLLLFGSPLTAFLIDAWHRIGSGSVGFPIIDEVYQRAKTQGVMPTVVRYEMGLVMGKVVMMALVVAVFGSGLGSWHVLFLLGAALAAFYGFFPRTNHGKPTFSP